MSKIRFTTKILSGFGQYPKIESRLLRPEFISDIPFPSDTSCIPRGQGRSYGDASLNQSGVVINTERLNRFLSFDPNTGILTAESGVTLKEILHTFIPRGFIPPVLPGTQHVSLGGCVASDIHGKNHHQVGSFAHHLDRIQLLLPSSQKIDCTPNKNSELFWATIGGMGLTGFITEVSFKLQPIETAFLIQKTQHTRDLEHTFQMLSKADHAPYSVAWLDGLTSDKHFGRGIVFSGHHALRNELPAMISDPLNIRIKSSHTVPFQFPSHTINRYSVKAFNAFYYAIHRTRETSSLVNYQAFFFPLDRIFEWHRLYGKHGFLQYQFVVPEKNALEIITRVFQDLQKNHIPPMLCVLKRLGPHNSGLLSFPMAGYTLALDIPVNIPGVFEHLNTIDNLICEAGGRVYLAKDARLHHKHFKKMYPRFSEFQRIKQQYDPDAIFSSQLMNRVLGISAYE